MSKWIAFNPFLSNEEEVKFLEFHNRIKSFLLSINGTTFFDCNIISSVKFREYEIQSSQQNSSFLTLTSYIQLFVAEKKKRKRKKRAIDGLHVAI